MFGFFTMFASSNLTRQVIELSKQLACCQLPRASKPDRKHRMNNVASLSQHRRSHPIPTWLPLTQGQLAKREFQMRFNSSPSLEILSGYLCSEFSYPSADRLFYSIEFGAKPSLIDAVVAAESFVARLMHPGEHLPFQFEMRAEGSRVTTEPKLAEAFYNLVYLFSSLNLLDRSFGARRHQFSPAFHLVQRVLADRGVHQLQFSGSPMQIIGSDCFHEGLFVNGVVNCIQSEARSRGYITEVRKLKDVINATCSAIRSRIKRIQSHEPLRGSAQFVLYLNPSNGYAGQDDLRQFSKILEKFFCQLFSCNTFSQVSAIVWHIKYAKEIGFHVTLQLLSPRVSIANDSDIHQLFALWRDTAGSAANFFYLGYLAIDHVQLTNYLVQQARQAYYCRPPSNDVMPTLGIQPSTSFTEKGMRASCNMRLVSGQADPLASSPSKNLKWG